MNKKKVLIVTYYWPPAGGPGVQRWLKFVKYLPEFNINPVVFIPENPNYPIVDASLSSEVSKDVSIVKHPIKEPYKWAGVLSNKSSKTISKGIISDEKEQSFIEKALLFVRGNFFIPDARVGWVKPSVEFLVDYIKKEGIQTVITTGPPHSVHLIGLQLKQKLGVTWLADFRDPWTTIGYHKQLKLMPSSKAKHKAFEAQVLKGADQIIVTSFTTKKEFRQITDKPTEVITNGYDNEGFVDVTLDTKFTISHIGSLLSKRNPNILWKALQELVSENLDFARDFQLNIVGFASEHVLESIKQYYLSKYVNNEGYVSHSKAIEFQKKSQVLLLIEIDSEDTKCIIPGKLFEYMMSHRPIISIGPEGSDVEKIITETNTGNYFTYRECEVLKSTILKHYKAFKSNNLQTQPLNIEQYHRKALTKLLANLL